MSQQKFSSAWRSSPLCCSAVQSSVDPTASQNSHAVGALPAADAKAESRLCTLPPQRPRRNLAGLIALAFLSISPLRAAPLMNSASALTSAAARAHPHEYCRFLTNGHLQVGCEFETMEQCKHSAQQCERYPFLAYCQFGPDGQIQRCDFDTLAECQAASSGFAGNCGPSPFLTTPEAPMPVNQTSPYSKRSIPH